MTSNKKDPVLVILQMTGAYDALNTFIPYSDPHYADYRPTLQIGPDEVLAVDDKVGFHPAMGPIKDLYDQGKVAVMQGIGYPNPNRSHFRLRYLPGPVSLRPSRREIRVSILTPPLLTQARPRGACYISLLSCQWPGALRSSCLPDEA